MIQDSKEYKFDKDKITDEYINNVIRSRQKSNGVPNLANVKVYVAGASAADSEKISSDTSILGSLFRRKQKRISPLIATAIP